MPIDATPKQLRDRYRKGLVDEFERHDDGALGQFILRALETVGQYVATDGLSAAAETALINALLILARHYAHEDRTYSDEHPVVREYRRILDWLVDLSRGRASLPGMTATSPGSGIAVVAPTRRYTQIVIDSMTPL